MEIGLGMLVAYVLNVVSIVLVYHGLFQLCRILFRKSPFLFVGFLIFVSPFAYVLARVSNLVELMWVLALTPFFGVAVMMALFTSWMIRFYSIAFSVLAVMHFLFWRKPANGGFPKDNARWTFFQRLASEAREGTSIADSVTRRMFSLTRVFRKYWNFVLIAAMALMLVSTLVNFGGAELRNPTYREALSFVASDKTDQAPYDRPSACAIFAREFQSNAKEAGLNCGYVVVYFPDGRSHALNAFNTTDSGMVFVEPQSDEIVPLTVGQPYWNRARYVAPDYDDTILGFLVEW